MRTPKKTYLDLFLDNHSKPKKRERYFEEKEELAIIKYNDPETSQKDKNKIFQDIIDPCFRSTISGVLEMRMFRNLPKALNREELIDNTFFRLLEKIYKFNKGKIGKNGQPVRAFSYFSTVAKNYILEQITKHNKVLKHKADVETSIDLSILSEETLEKISKTDSTEVVLDDYITIFSSVRGSIIEVIKELIIDEESKDKKDEEFIKLGYCLKYLLEKWNKIEFMKKNEFMRILTLYTGFPQQKVSFLFKRFKIATLKKIKPNALNKNKKRKVEFEEELFEVEIVEEETIVVLDDEDDILNSLIDLDELEEEEDEIIEYDKNGKVKETEEEKIMKYNISSMDEFEAREYKLDNAKKRKEWRKTKRLKVTKTN